MTLCTKCSSQVRPVVALDIDGTLADYHGALFKFAGEFWNRTMCGDGYEGNCHLHEYMDVSREEYRVMKLAFRQGGQKRMMPVIEGAQELAKELHNAGAEIWITTTRPWQRFDSTDPDTRHWLDRNGIYWDHLLFDDDKYGVLSDVVDPSRVVAVLEDLPELYDRALELELHPWLIKTKYNRAYSRKFELANLREARLTLVEKVQLWQP